LRKDTIAKLQNAGATVVVSLADIAVPEQLARALAQPSTAAAGRNHSCCSGFGRTAPFRGWTPSRFEKVMRPKVDGAWNLHKLTEGIPLDFFVMFSSAASVMGSPGQANYSAANAYLDALAHYRRWQGKPALSFNWGRGRKWDLPPLRRIAVRGSQRKVWQALRRLTD
jgi:myxalamid-type polyketide synthase MxaB